MTGSCEDDDDALDAEESGEGVKVGTEEKETEVYDGVEDEEEDDICPIEGPPPSLVCIQVVACVPQAD